MSVDSIGDFLTTIRNGTMVAKPFVVTPFSKMNYAIAQILQKEGFVGEVVAVDVPDSSKKNLKISLRYVDGESVIHEIKRVSTPGRREYVSSATIKPVIGGLGLSILSTDCGVVSHKEAKRRRVGGEIMCTVW